jgi:hypothetical protein
MRLDNLAYDGKPQPGASRARLSLAALVAEHKGRYVVAIGDWFTIQARTVRYFRLQ